MRPLISFARAGTTLSEVAHFGGDHREAAALFAGTRRFDGCVQRQQVGLEGDLVDDADDVGDLAARVVDLAHRGDRALHHCTALFRLLASTDGQLIRLARVVRVLFHRRGHLLHARSGFFQGGSLFLRTLREIVVAV